MRLKGGNAKMIIDEETRMLRNKQVAKERVAAKRESWRIKRQSNKILKRLREEYIATGKTQEIEILACTYPRWDMTKVLQRLVDMKFITYTNRSDAYYVDFVMPEKTMPNTKEQPKARSENKAPKPNIEDFDPSKDNPWSDLG